ncbi:MAG: HDIG domain-containing metalloprotein [Mycoplasmoidaceae bacterium]
MTENYSFSNLDWILISICLLLFFLTILFLVLLIRNKIKIRKNNKLDLEKESLEQAIIKYDKLNENLKFEIDEYLKKSSAIAKLSIEDAKKILMEDIEELYKYEFSKKIKYLKEQNEDKVKEISSNILINSMEQILEDVIAKTSLNINVNEEMKGRLVGKNGSMLHEFERITGANLRIEPDSPATISCFNPLKREIAIRTFKSLLNLNIINFEKIDKAYKNECKKIDEEMVNFGKQFIEENRDLKSYIPEGLYYYIGRLYYRTSYTQSAFTHSVECANISSYIAKEIGFDSTKAKLCGFMHDIGKSIDYEENNDHVESGIKLAKKFNLPDYVINTIHSHHGAIKPDNIYAVIAKIADTISASRPGVRKTDFKENIERIESIENICKSFEGVNNAYVLKSGRTVKVIVDSTIINNDNINILEKKLLARFNEEKLNLNVPIEVIIIKDRNG